MLNMLPLGDSITLGALNGGFSPGGYRVFLERMLVAGGTEFRFIGSTNENADDSQREIWHEGHSGWSILPGRGYPGIMENLPNWAAEYGASPDIILLHIGVNDIHWPTPGTVVFERFKALMAALANTWPNVAVVTSTLVGTDELEFQRECEVFNELLLADESLAPVARMDLALKRPDHFWDPLHPNRAGHEKMAECWLETMHSTNLL